MCFIRYRTRKNVRGIVGSFIAHKFNREEATIRIGISGAGIVPNYYIEEPAPSVTITISGLDLTTREVFSGRNHKQILDDFLEGEKWSSAVMTFAEVQAALGQLRASKKAH